MHEFNYIVLKGAFWQVSTSSLHVEKGVYSEGCTDKWMGVMWHNMTVYNNKYIYM